MNVFNETTVGDLFPDPKMLAEVRDDAIAQHERDCYPCEVMHGLFYHCPDCGEITAADDEADDIANQMGKQLGCECFVRSCRDIAIQYAKDEISDGELDAQYTDLFHDFISTTKTLYFARYGYIEGRPVAGPYDTHDEALESWSDDEDKVREMYDGFHEVGEAAVAEALEEAGVQDEDEYDLEAADRLEKKAICVELIRQASHLYRQGR